MVAVALLTSPVLLAHHGTAGTYDRTKLVKVEGVVKEFRWRNPHSTLVLTGKDSAGNDVIYAFEMQGPGGLAKRGWTNQTFKPGDKITLDMRPAYGNPYVGQPVSKTITINGVQVTGVEERETE